MGKSIPITIGTSHYPSKVTAKDAVRKLISKYNFKEMLNDQDMEFCLELFKHHSEYDQKIGCGVKSIEVRKDEHGNKYFHLLRFDDSDEDISWVHCISPKKQKTVIYEALRSIVKHQVQEFKSKELEKEPVCQFYGVKLNLKNSHVDHYDPTFEMLVASFIKKLGRELSEDDLVEQEGTDFRGILNDKNLLTAWDEFHKINANLRLISAKANLSIAKV